jgi:hypothetical protein
MAILANEAEYNLGGAAYRNYNLNLCLNCLRGGQVEEATPFTPSLARPGPRDGNTKPLFSLEEHA